MLIWNKFCVSIYFMLSRYLTADCNYGGRVFDYFDRRLLRNLLKRRFNLELARERKYPLSESGIYKVCMFSNDHSVTN